MTPVIAALAVSAVGVGALCFGILVGVVITATTQRAEWEGDDE